MYWNSRKGKYGYKKENKKIAVLCFSHGAFIKNFSASINNGRKPDDSCGYCGITAMSVKNSKMKIEMIFNDAHIS